METKKQQQTDTPGRKALRQGLKRAAQVYDPIFGDVRVMLGEIDVLVEKIRSRLTMISAEHELRQAEIELARISKNRARGRQKVGRT
jgi:hypothetical protein